MTTANLIDQPPEVKGRDPLSYALFDLEHLTTILKPPFMVAILILQLSTLSTQQTTLNVHKYLAINLDIGHQSLSYDSYSRDD